MKIIFIKLNPSDVQGAGFSDFFSGVFLRFFQDHLLLAHAVFSSYLFILETHFGKVQRQSVAMLTKYDAISSMLSSHF